MNIENKLDSYNEIYKIIKKNNSIDIKILFLPDNKKKINEFLDEIKHFGEIFNFQNNNKENFQDDFMNENNKVNQLNNQDNQINYQNQNNILLNYKYNINNSIKKNCIILDNNDRVEDDIFYFKFLPGKNYSVSNNRLMAKKNNGGNYWNCTIIGDKEIPKNKKSEWKIKITNFKIDRI